MSEINIMIRYLGMWEVNDQKHTYIGGKSKGVIVSSIITYAELLDKISDIMKINCQTHSVEMKYNYNAYGTMEPVTIEGDDDVVFFLRSNMDRSIPATCLCISTSEKTDISHNIDNTFTVDACLFENSDFDGPITNDTDLGNPNLDDSMLDCPNVVVPGFDNSSFEDLSGVSSSSIGTSQNCDVHESLRVNEVFTNKKSLYKKLCLHAMKMHFQFDVIKSTKHLLVVGCHVLDCKWWLRATRVPNTSFFVIKVYRNDHLSSSCFECHVHRQATGWVIGQCIKSKYEGVGRIYRPNDIVEDFQREHGIPISYNKAWRARESALDSLHGSPEDSFAELASFFAQLELKNPGSVTHIEYDLQNRFKYSFMALGPSLRGFRNCMRPVICVDGTHLKGKYLGTLFVATCLDGNNQVYPLAFGVGDSENDASWKWFFEKLRGAINVTIDDLVIISDRNSSIDKGIQLVFNDRVFHGICMYHISQNMKAKKFDESVIPLFVKAAKAYRKTDFHHLMNQIRGFDNGKVFKYLHDAGYHKWARTFFPKDRYNIMTTNIAECLNGILKDARSLPITKLMEHLVKLLQKWFHDRRLVAIGMTNHLCTYHDKIAVIRCDKSRSMKVDPISLNEFNVIDGDAGGLVDLFNKTCSCRVFDIDHMPCVHAFAACRARNLPTLPLWSPYYTSEMLVHAYAEPIYPILRGTDYPTIDEGLVLLPPATRRPAGRPRKRRILSSGESVVARICSRCKMHGHNRQTCKEPIAL